jgi:hypothetical protein
MGAIAAAAAGLAVGAALLASAVFAQATGGVEISDGSAEPGQSGDVTVSSTDVTDPGLGAWTLDVTYDPDVISPINCEPAQGGVCNPNFDSDTVRLTGASANGLDDSTDLGTITFECADAEAESALDLEAEVFADATIGDPQDIDVTPGDGTFTCAVATPVPTTGPAATATTAGPSGIVSTGTGGSDSSDSFGWVIAGLAGAGLAAIAGVGALRVRSRRA